MTGLQVMAGPVRVPDRQTRLKNRPVLNPEDTISPRSPQNAGQPQTGECGYEFLRRID